MGDKELQSIFQTQTDKKLLERQNAVLRSIYKQYNIDYDSLSAALRKFDIDNIKQINLRQLEAIHAHMWVLENAVIQGRENGLTIMGFIRMMTDFRSRLRR